MTLESGQTLSHYRIDVKIGEGGMGQVYRATDTRLNRPVALKVLPEEFTRDADRMARFAREAQLLASLNHPNIAAIYGLEEVGEQRFLALELVEGDDLSDRIAAGPLPMDEALEIAGQIAAALEEAHDKGVIHRDLKPANVKVTPDGAVKVLDFGLAKALAGDGAGGTSSAELSVSPTVTAFTQAGLILGTAAYMAPEQARGRTVDRRADLWAFGVVLFEMLTGARLYTGETITDVIAAVVTREPDWDRLPADTPPAVRRLLRRCLQKDPRMRLRDIGDARLELTESDEDLTAATPTAAGATTVRPRRAVVLAIGLIAGALLTAIGFAILGSRLTGPPVTWSTLPSPAGAPYEFRNLLEISPDGRHLVFVAPAPDGSDSRLLWVRDLQTEQARSLTGTEGAQQPFWSPDSRFIAYFSKGKLRKISVDGGVPAVLADAGGDPRGGAWGADGTILFVPDWSRPVSRVSESGGASEPATTMDPKRLDLSHRWPQFLPDGEHFLFFIVSTYPELNPENPSELDQSGLYVQSLDGGDPKLVHTARSRTSYRDGSLVFVDDGFLIAQPFDLAKLELHGEPVSLAGGVTQSVDALWGGALFSASEEGTMIFVRGAPERHSRSRFVWRDREGNEIGTVGDVAAYNSLRLSHDGRRLAASMGEPGEIWVFELDEGTSSRFTFNSGNDDRPLWSPDDSRIVFQSIRVIPGEPLAPSNLMARLTSGLGEAEHLTSRNIITLPSDWSSDGSLVAMVGLNPGTGADILIYSLESGDVETFLATDHDEDQARFSSDGQWIAYRSQESGRSEVYVRAFSGPGGLWQISTDGGHGPVWRADGKELFYIDPDGTILAVPVDTSEGFRAGTPVKLFSTGGLSPLDNDRSYDVSPDGQRILLLEAVEEDGGTEASVTLVQNWRSLLPERD